MDDGLDGSCAAIPDEDGGVTNGDACVACVDDRSADDGRELLPLGKVDVPSQRRRNRSSWPLLTSSVMRSKYTNRLRKTSYVVGQYLCILVR